VLISLNVSLDILLAVVLVLRIVWRRLTHQHMAPAVSGFSMWPQPLCTSFSTRG